MAPYETIDGELVPGRDPGGVPSRAIGGFHLEARRVTSWHAIVELLVHLHEERPSFFTRLMRGCVAVSDGALEVDGCDEVLRGRDQQLADLAFDREERRDREGYVAPAQARAFLEGARSLSLTGAQPPADPIAAASLRDLAAAPPLADEPVAGLLEGSAADAVADAGAMIAVMEVLADAGLVTPPRALMEGTAPDETRLALVHAFAESHATAAEELGFLANALLSGCGLQGRAFTPQAASDVVLATCNLGLECWPDAWPECDLVRAFQVGWALLHHELCGAAAQALIDVLADISCSDRDVQLALQALRRELVQALAAGEPWRARPSLDAILTLDAAAWAGLLGMIDECPTLHAAVTSPGLLRSSRRRSASSRRGATSPSRTCGWRSWRRRWSGDQPSTSRERIVRRHRRAAERNPVQQFDGLAAERRVGETVGAPNRHQFPDHGVIAPARRLHHGHVEHERCQGQLFVRRELSKLRLPVPLRLVDIRQDRIQRAAFGSRP